MCSPDLIECHTHTHTHTHTHRESWENQTKVALSITVTWQHHSPLGPHSSLAAMVGFPSFHLTNSHHNSSTPNVISNVLTGVFLQYYEEILLVYRENHENIVGNQSSLK